MMRAALARAHGQSLRSSSRLRNLLILLATFYLGFELGALLPASLPDTDSTISGTSPINLATPVHHIHKFTNRVISSLDTQPSDDSSQSSPYVQSLDADWQRHWLGRSNVSGYRTIADADCLLFHETAERKRCVLPRTNNELVREAHVAYSVCGHDVQEMAVTSIKSFILHRHSSVTLHVWLILSPYDNQTRFLNDTISRWPAQHQPYPIRNATDATVFLHYIDLDAVLASDFSPVLNRAKRHLALFKPCSSIRLWLPQLLPSSVSLVLYVDCDTLVIRDYREIFAHAQLYSPTQMISFAYEGTSKQCGSWYFLLPVPKPAPLPYAVNAGVLLINLTRARSDEMQSLYSERLLLLLAVSNNFLMGDQDVYNRWIGQMQNESRDVFFPLPLSYNWRECAFVEPGQSGGMTLMHGNAYKFHNAKDEPFWAATYQSYYLWHQLPSNPTMPVKQ